VSDIAQAGPHTDAVIVLLEAAGLLVLDGGPPLNQPRTWGWEGTPGQSSYRPYVTVNSLPGGTFGGPVGCPDDDADLIWGVTCVAETRKRCQDISDKVTAALVRKALPVAGRSTWMQLDMDGGVRRDDTVQPAVYISTPRFRATSTPA
jgi:hypothetical protein